MTTSIWKFVSESEIGQKVIRLEAYSFALRADAQGVRRLTQTVPINLCIDVQRNCSLVSVNTNFVSILELLLFLWVTHVKALKSVENVGDDQV